MVSDAEIANAVLQAVDGLFPESDDVSSVEISSSNLPAILQLLQETTESIKSEIRHIGQSQQDEVTAWTQEARQLHTELAQDHEALHRITHFESHGTKLDDRVQDLSSQQALLTDEIAFNQELVALLSELKALQDIVDEAEAYAAEGSLDKACGRFEDASRALERLSGSDQVLAVGLVKENLRALKEGLIGTVEKCWTELISFSPNDASIAIHQTVPFGGASVPGESIVNALERLGVLKERLDRLHHKLTTILIFPRLKPKTGDGWTFTVNSEHTALQLQRRKKPDSTAAALYADLKTAFDFLSERLGPSISRLLSKTLTPAVLHQLMGSYLPECIPADIARLNEFEVVLKESGAFEDYLRQAGWLHGGRGELGDWVSRAPRIWLNRRRESALNSLRQTFSKGLGERHRVERIERVKEVDGVLKEAPKPIDEGEDNWDSNWDVEVDDVDAEEPKKTEPAAATARPKANETKMDEDEDVSGWGFDDDIEIEEEPQEDPVTTSKPQHVMDDDENMDWGDWGDDGGHAQHHNTTAAATTHKANGNTKEHEVKDVTLREYYTITSIPQEVINIILHTVEEAEKLSRPEYAGFTVSSSTSGLLNIPTSILTAYRALSSIFYREDSSPAICIYNDCEWLEESLVELEKDVKGRAGPFSGFDLQPGIKAISSFGKRSFWGDMDSKRLILSDLMDGAQGFENCTQYPMSNNCDTAIASVIDAIQGVEMQWRDTLSRSALLQSIGTLLNTVITKFINDIEDLSSIGADASAKLAGYVADIGRLEPLFVLPDQPKDTLPMTAVYCEKWLKFQYLGTILEGSMSEIMDLWRDGALVDFEREELMDLVKALFEDNGKRREILDELRMG